MSLVIVGTVAFDTIETPFGKADMVVGGAALYGSIAASHYTDDVQLVSVIGEDFPQGELDYMASRGINQEGLQLKKGEKSFYWSGRYHDNMNKRDTLVTDLNVLETFDPVLPDNYKESEYVMLGNLTPAVQMQVVDQMILHPHGSNIANAAGPEFRIVITALFEGRMMRGPAEEKLDIGNSDMPRSPPK